MMSVRGAKHIGNARKIGSPFSFYKKIAANQGKHEFFSAEPNFAPFDCLLDISGGEMKKVPDDEAGYLVELVAGKAWKQFQQIRVVSQIF